MAEPDLLPAFLRGRISHVIDVSSQPGNPPGLDHRTNFLGFSSATFSSSFGPPNPNVAVDPTLGSAWLSLVQKLASPFPVEIAS